MPKCDTCGNDYSPILEVTYRGDKYQFDCFECAIQRLAPVCEHCHCRVIGHGVDRDGMIFCCENCARHVKAA